MIYTPMTKTALKLCFEAHTDQTDESGMPRLDEVADRDRKRAEKYKKAIELLESSD